MAGIDSGVLMQMYNAGMTLDEIKDRFKNDVSDDIWHEFIRSYSKRIEYSVGYHAKNLTQIINDMRKLGYSDVQISFHGGFEFTDPHGDTIKLRGI